MRARSLDVVVAAVLVVVGAGASGCRPTETLPPRVCNGHAELCERSLADVVFAGAHNAMSSRDDGFLGPNQSLALPGQLRFGVRAFLIDTKVPDPDDVAAGARLCHGSCSLGSLPLSGWLAQLRAFLDDEPNTVVQLLVEDEASVADTEATFVAAGLVDELYVYGGGDFATLGALIDDGTRIFMTAESPTETPPWFLSMFTLYSDTDFAHDDLAALQASSSCDLNRGAANDPLLLVNHWIGVTAAEENADIANAKDVLDERVRRCMASRQRTANVVAVDFIDHGDVIEVVDGLNGVD